MFGWPTAVPRPADRGHRSPAWPGLARARGEAARRGSRSVGTQHLLLALLSDPDGEVRDLLAAAGVALASVEETLAGIQGSGARVAPVAPEAVGLSTRAAAVLARAAGDGTGGAPTDRHVLAALLESDDPAVGRLVLRYIGARSAIRDALAQYRSA